MGSNSLDLYGEFVDAAQKRGGMQQNVGMGNPGVAGKIHYTLLLIDRVPGYAGGDVGEIL